jgi:hypothetical protein
MRKDEPKREEVKPMKNQYKQKKHHQRKTQKADQ